MKKALNTPFRATTRPRHKDRSPAKSDHHPKSYSRDDLQFFKNLILERRKEALEDIDILRASLAEAHSLYEIDVAPHSEREFYERSFTGLTLERDARHIDRQTRFVRSLETALLRIAEGTYGLCLHCGQLIEKERLEAVPNTRLCVRCKKGETREA